jgi:hemoglobin
MEDIGNRRAIYLLVSTFYEAVQKDLLLGAIFSRTIGASEWPAHIEKLTDFWETNIFGSPKFTGNPVEAHRKVDKKEDYTLSQEHFDQWISIWFSTVDDLFKGPNAEKAKERARRMATGQFLKILQARPIKDPER